MGGSKNGKNFNKIFNPPFHQLQSQKPKKQRTSTNVQTTNPNLKPPTKQTLRNTKKTQHTTKITANNDNQALPPTTERWNWKKADWDAFSKTLAETVEATKEIWTQLH